MIQNVVAVFMVLAMLYVLGFAILGMTIDRVVFGTSKRKKQAQKEAESARDKMVENCPPNESFFYSSHYTQEALAWAQSREIDFFSLPIIVRDAIYALFGERNGLLRILGESEKMQSFNDIEARRRICSVADNIWFFCRGDMKKIGELVALILSPSDSFGGSVYLQAKKLPDSVDSSCKELRARRLKNAGNLSRGASFVETCAVWLRDSITGGVRTPRWILVLMFALLPITAILTPLILFVLQPLARRLLGARRLTQAMILADVLAGAKHNARTVDMPVEMTYSMVFYPCYGGFPNNKDTRNNHKFQPGTTSGIVIVKNPEIYDNLPTVNAPTRTSAQGNA